MKCKTNVKIGHSILAKGVYKLIYDNELLIIQNDTEDLLIADDFNVNEYAHVSNIYEHVRIGNFE